LSFSVVCLGIALRRASAGSEGLTPEDMQRLLKARTYLALGWQQVRPTLEAGLEAVVIDILKQATGLLAQVAAEVTSAITGQIAAKLLKVAKVDHIYEQVATNVGTERCLRGDIGAVHVGHRFRIEVCEHIACRRRECRALRRTLDSGDLASTDCTSPVVVDRLAEG